MSKQCVLWSSLAALAGAGALAGAAEGAIMPSVVFGILDDDLDGAPDAFSSASLADAILTRLDERRSFAEFPLAGFGASNAAITGRFVEGFSFGFGTTPADFVLEIYEGNGAADLTDWDAPAVSVATFNLNEDFDDLAFNVSVSSAIQDLIDNGATHAGLRARTIDANVGQVDINDLELVPTPGAVALLGPVGLLALRRRRA